MATPHPATFTVIALLPLVGWSVWRRIKRMVGRQRLSRVRPWVTLTLFPLLLAMLSMSAFVAPQAQPQRLVWLAAGVVIGAALAVYGLKRTRFESTPEGLFYTPDSRIGIAISVLLITRVVYRIGRLLVLGPQLADSTEFAYSPYTLAPVGMLAGYYMVYAAGLIRGRWAMLRRQSTRSTP
jgi:hypothetical protein